MPSSILTLMIGEATSRISPTFNVSFELGDGKARIGSKQFLSHEGLLFDVRLAYNLIALMGVRICGWQFLQS